MSTRPAMVTDDGVLGRVGALVYWLAVIEVCLLVACAPTILVALLYGLAGGGLVPVVAATVFVAPAFAAAQFAWGRRARLQDMNPLRHFIRGYRLNLLEVLAWWVPLVLLFTAMAVSFSSLEAYDGPSWLPNASLVLAALLLVLSSHLVDITALFSFRLRDRIRLAVYFFFSRPLVTLGYAALYLIFGTVAWFVGELLAMCLLSVLSLFAYANARPVHAELGRRFVAPGGEDD